VLGLIVQTMSYTVSSCQCKYQQRSHHCSSFLWKVSSYMWSKQFRRLGY